MTQIAQPTTQSPTKGETRAPLESDALASRLVALIIQYRPAPSRKAMAREARRILATLDVQAPR